MHRSSRPSNVEIRADDRTLTGHAGLLLTGELAARTDLVTRLDRAIDAVRPFKLRRGRSGGELLVALAELMVVGEVLTPTTARQLMRRLDARQCQAAVAELAKVGEEVDRQLGLTAAGPLSGALRPDRTRDRAAARRRAGRARAGGPPRRRTCLPLVVCR